MKIKTFKVEQWMNDYEDDAIYNLGETCIDSMTLGELIKLSGQNPEEYLAALKDKDLKEAALAIDKAYKAAQPKTRFYSIEKK